MSYKSNLNHRLTIAVILTIVGSGLLIAGFIVPPLGVIDSSVLVAFGETSTFVAAILGIENSARLCVNWGLVVEHFKEVA